MAYRHPVRIRYGECDMQRVVFNAHYFAYLDDAVLCWMAATVGDIEEAGFDYMVKKMTVEWHSPARYGDPLVLDCAVTRWGRTSFDVLVEASAEERPVLTAHVVYVSTTPGEAKPVPVPEHVRAALGG
jgi:acyl-CoA thioester hydrolase